MLSLREPFFAPALAARVTGAKNDPKKRVLGCSKNWGVAALILYFPFLHWNTEYIKTIVLHPAQF